MMDRKVKKILAAILTLAMVFALAEPVLSGPSKAQAANDKTKVYISLAKRQGNKTDFVGKGDTKLIKLPVEVSYFDLADYGLEDYKLYQDGKEVKKATALHAMIKFAEQYYLDGAKLKKNTDALSVSGNSESMSIDKFCGCYGYTPMTKNLSIPLSGGSDPTVLSANNVEMDEGDELDFINLPNSQDGAEYAIGLFNDSYKSLRPGEKYQIYYHLLLESGESEGRPGESLRVSSDGGKTWKDFPAKTNKEGKLEFCFNTAGDFIVTGPQRPAGEYWTAASLPILKVKVEGDPIVDPETGKLEAQKPGNPINILEKEDSGDSEPTLVDKSDARTFVGGYVVLPYIDGALKPNYPMKPEDMDFTDLTWKAEDSSVVDVYQDGVVYGKKNGATKVVGRGKVNGKDYVWEYDVTVVPKTQDIKLKAWAEGTVARVTWTRPEGWRGVRVYKANERDGKFKYSLVNILADKKGNKTYSIASRGKVAIKLVPYIKNGKQIVEGPASEECVFTSYTKRICDRYRDVSMQLERPKGWSQKYTRWYNVRPVCALMYEDGNIKTRYPGEARIAVSKQRETYNYYIRVRPYQPTQFMGSTDGSKLTLTWKPAFRADGYYVYYAKQDQDGGYAYKLVRRVVGDQGLASFTIGQGRHKVYVRSYTVMGGKRYISKRTRIMTFVR